MISASTILLILTTLSIVRSFDPSCSFHIRPGLDELAKKQDHVQLQLNLDIGQENTFAIRDMVLELQKFTPKEEDEYTMLPGADGWCKNVSSQRRSMKILQSGSFVNMKGQQSVEMFRPSWELLWPKETLSGSLVMGFELPRDYSRNEYSTTFSNGNICLRFQVWSKSSLASAQVKRERLVHEHAQLYQQRKDELHSFNTCRNPIQKILLLRRALLASEELERASTTLKAAGPDLSSDRDEEYNDNVIVKLRDDLYVTKVGSIYRQKGKYDGEHRHEIIGTAHVVKELVSKQEEGENSFVSPPSSRRRLRP